MINFFNRQFQKYRLETEIIFWTGCALGYLCLLGHRLSLFASVALSDPAGYPGLARASHFFFDSASREPFQIFLVKIALKLVSNDETAVRLISLFFTEAAFVTAVMGARFLWGFWAGAGAALALASNRVAGFYSTTGYNMVTYSFFIVLLAVFFLQERRGRWAAPLMGLVSALASLTRLEGLATTTLGQVLYFWKPRPRPWRAACLALCLSWGLTAPYLIVQKIRTGQFLGSHKPHAAFWAVREKSGQDHGADPPSSQANAWKNLFLRRGPADAFLQAAQGMALGFAWYLPRLWQGAEWALALALLGLVVLWRRGHKSFALLLAAIIAPVAFILPLDQVTPGSGAELRFTLPLIWPTAMLTGLGFSWTIRTLAERFNMIR